MQGMVVVGLIVEELSNINLKFVKYRSRSLGQGTCQARWLSWMRRPTGDQEVAGSTPAEVGSILSWRLIMKYFLRSFSPFR